MSVKDTKWLSKEVGSDKRAGCPARPLSWGCFQRGLREEGGVISEPETKAAREDGG